MDEFKTLKFFFDFVYLVGRHPFDRKFVHPRLWWRCRRKRSVQSRRQPKSASRKSCAVSFSMESNNSDNNDTITVGESCENNRPIESSIKSIFVIEFHHHLVQPIAFFTQTTTNTDDEIINSRAQDTQPENSGKFKWYQFLFSLFFFFFLTTYSPKMSRKTIDDRQSNQRYKSRLKKSLSWIRLFCDCWVR